ncbi:hypothetical protein K0M31_000961 [Melipona bicolor]|uniref:Uncharacterized protein n=1 Tax=Melipona bicolor TaxID=60889 RepID=A0AA40GEL8_9HYME|nr:hypothetical protein K0M31_000961 [Melipona bicolor]
MEGREGLFSRNEPSRSSIRPQSGGRKSLETAENKQRQTIGGYRGGNRESASPASSPTAKYVATAHTPMDNLKQWELVECDRRLQVVEKRSASSKGAAIERTPSLNRKNATPIADRRNLAIDASLEEKLKAFKESNIIQPVAAPRRDDKADRLPINLDLILKQRKGSSAAESTDMLQRLEQQVKAIEMDTLAARTRQLEFSSDFEPEIRYTDLRYREHEDLLRNVTDDEAEGASPLHRGDATRNSTGNAGVTTKKASTKLSRTASDTRRGQEAEVPLRAQTRVQQARALVAARANNAKKDHRHHQQQQQQQQRQTTTVSSASKPLSNVTQKSGVSEKERKLVAAGEPSRGSEIVGNLPFKCCGHFCKGPDLHAESRYSCVRTNNGQIPRRELFDSGD